MKSTNKKFPKLEIQAFYNMSINSYSFIFLSFKKFCRRRKKNKKLKKYKKEKSKYFKKSIFGCEKNWMVGQISS
jgi:hypothetical protein